MSPVIPESEKRLLAQIAANASWRQTDDRSARTAPARRAAAERFEKLVDPDSTLTPTERAKRAENARKEHYARMALKSAQARRRRSVGGAA